MLFVKSEGGDLRSEEALAARRGPKSEEKIIFRLNVVFIKNIDFTEENDHPSGPPVGIQKCTQGIPRAQVGGQKAFFLLLLPRIW